MSKQDIVAIVALLASVVAATQAYSICDTSSSDFLLPQGSECQLTDKELSFNHVSINGTVHVFGYLKIVSTSAQVGTQGRLDGSERGYPAEEGPGARRTTCPDGYRAGGAHSGYSCDVEDSDSIRDGDPGTTYGDVMYPQTKGSGGMHGSGSQGGAGGASISIIVTQSLSFEGRIYANGESLPSCTSCYGGGGGAGGSVLVEAAQVSKATGYIYAQGGNGAYDSTNGRHGYGGSGGRIAFRCTTFTGTLDDILLSTYGGRRGNTNLVAGAGTSYIDCGSVRGNLTLDGGPSASQIAAPSRLDTTGIRVIHVFELNLQRYASLAIGGVDVADQPAVVSATHFDASTSTVWVRQTGAFLLHVNLNGSSHGASYATFRELTTSNTDGILLTTTLQELYTATSVSSMLLPVNIYASPGSFLSLPGSITVGSSRTLEAHGLLAGVSAFIVQTGGVVSLREESYTLAGGGTAFELAIVDLQGSARMDLNRTKLAISNELTMSGSSRMNILEDGSIQASNVQLSGSSRITGTLSKLLVDLNVELADNAAIYLANATLTASLLSLADSSRLYVSFKVDLEVSNMYISTDAEINGDGRGYMPNMGPGAGLFVGDGASHSGYAMNGSRLIRDVPLGLVGAPYGEFDKPIEPGSGGYQEDWPCCDAGAGGAAIFIYVDQVLDMRGTISAEGSNAQSSTSSSSAYFPGGGGSGGSIYIRAKTLASSSVGTFSVRGGNGGRAYNEYAGGGSGGRMAMYCNQDTGNAIGNINFITYGGRFGSGSLPLSAVGTAFIDCGVYTRTLYANNGYSTTNNNAPAQIVNKEMMQINLFTIKLRSAASLKFTPVGVPTSRTLWSTSTLDMDRYSTLHVSDYQTLAIFVKPDTTTDMFKYTSDSTYSATREGEFGVWSSDTSSIEFLTSEGTVSDGTIEVASEGALFAPDSLTFAGTSNLNCEGQVLGSKRFVAASSSRIHFESPRDNMYQFDVMALNDSSYTYIGEYDTLYIASNFEMSDNSRIYARKYSTLRLPRFIMTSSNYVNLDQGVKVDVSGSMEVQGTMNTDLTHFRVGGNITFQTSLSGQLSSLDAGDSIYFPSTSGYTVNMAENTNVTAVNNISLGSAGILKLAGTSYLQCKHFEMRGSAQLNADYSAPLKGKHDAIERGSGGSHASAGTPINFYNDLYAQDVDWSKSYAPYGDFRYPTEPGANGANGNNPNELDCCEGGRGGGAIIVRATKSALLEGYIYARGSVGSSAANRPRWPGGGGAGGSVLVHTSLLRQSSSSLNIYLNGARGGYADSVFDSSTARGGGGSGGRAAILCDADPSDSVSGITFYLNGGQTYGQSSLAAGAGTAYMSCGSMQGVVRTELDWAQQYERPSFLLLKDDERFLQLHRLEIIDYAGITVINPNAPTDATVFQVNEIYGNGRGYVMTQPYHILALSTGSAVSNGVQFDDISPLQSVWNPSLIEHINDRVRHITLGDAFLLNNASLRIRENGYLLAPQNFTIVDRDVHLEGELQGEPDLYLNGSARFDIISRADQASNTTTFVNSVSVSDNADFYINPNRRLVIHDDLKASGSGNLIAYTGSLLNIGGHLTAFDQATVTVQVGVEWTLNGDLSQFANSVVDLGPVTKFTNLRLDGGTLYMHNNVTASAAVYISTGASVHVDARLMQAATEIDCRPGGAIYVYMETKITAPKINLKWNCEVNGKARGYPSAEGPGVSTQIRAGGSYGGIALNDGYSESDGKAYGSMLRPLDPGSGGTNYGARLGGSGGAAVHIFAASELTLNATINVQGGMLSGDYCGGGSGGSILVETPNLLASNGSVDASGSNGGYCSNTDGAGGSGGRIAIHCVNDVSNTIADVAAKAIGGYHSQVTSRRSAAGTIYFNCGEYQRHMIVDNMYNKQYGMPTTHVTDMESQWHLNYLYIGGGSKLEFDGNFDDAVVVSVEEADGDGQGTLVLQSRHAFILGSMRESYDIPGHAPPLIRNGTWFSEGVYEWIGNTFTRPNRLNMPIGIDSAEGSFAILPEIVNITDIDIVMRGVSLGISQVDIHGIGQLIFHERARSLLASESAAVKLTAVELWDQARLELLGSNRLLDIPGRLFVTNESVLAVGTDTVISVGGNLELYNKSRIEINSKSVFSVGGRSWISGPSASITAEDECALVLGGEAQIFGGAALHLPLGNLTGLDSVIFFDGSMDGPIRNASIAKNWMLSKAATLIELSNSNITIGELFRMENQAVIEAHMSINITARKIELDATAVIDGEAKGYQRNEGPGCNKVVGTGGAHSAYGIDKSNVPTDAAIGDLGAPYDNAFFPVEPGSGGGGGSGGSGGSAIRLNAAHYIEMNGTINVNGGIASSSHGGGAGGSVLLVTDRLQFSNPKMYANGGRGGGSSPYGGGGSGGRIALHCKEDAGNSMNRVDYSAYGGHINGYIERAAGGGTVFFDCGSKNGYLGVDNLDPDRTFLPAYVFQDRLAILTLQTLNLTRGASVVFYYREVGTNATVVSIHDFIGDTSCELRSSPHQTVVLYGTSSDNPPISEALLPFRNYSREEFGNTWLEHSRTYSLPDGQFTLNACDLVVNAGSTLLLPERVRVEDVTVDIYGDVGGMANTTFGGLAAVTVYDGGQIYGLDQKGPEAAFDSIFTDFELSQDSRVTVPDNTSVLVLGGFKAFDRAVFKTGTGCSVRIEGMELQDDSRFEIGSNSTVTIVGDSTMLGRSKVIVGSGGKVTLNGNIILREDSNFTVSSAGHLQVSNTTVVQSSLTLSSSSANMPVMRVEASADLILIDSEVEVTDRMEVHLAGRVLVSGVVKIHAENAQLRTGSLIDGIGAGFAAEEGPGRGLTYADGASHGGFGSNIIGEAITTSLNSSGSPYGSTLRPVHAGSGGYRGSSSFVSDCCPGGAGGASLQILVSDTLVLNSTINMTAADGQSMQFPTAAKGGGGGSGGSILIETKKLLASSGKLSVRGGHGGWASTVQGAGGAGGRIAIYCTQDVSNTSHALQTEAWGGRVWASDVYSGGPGTVFFDCGDRSRELSVDNGDQKRSPWRPSYVLDSKVALVLDMLRVTRRGGLIFNPLGIGTNATALFVSRVVGDRSGVIQSVPRQTIVLGAMNITQVSVGVDIMPLLESGIDNGNVWRDVRGLVFDLSESSSYSLDTINGTIVEGSTLLLPRYAALAGARFDIDGKLVGCRDMTLSNYGTLNLGAAATWNQDGDSSIHVNTLKMDGGSVFSTGIPGTVTIDDWLSLNGSSRFDVGSGSIVNVIGAMTLNASANMTCVSGCSMVTGSLHIDASSTLDVGADSVVTSLGAFVMRNSRLRAATGSRLDAAYDLEIYYSNISDKLRSARVGGSLLLTGSGLYIYDGFARAEQTISASMSSTIFTEGSVVLDAPLIEIDGSSAIDGIGLGYAVGTGPGEGSQPADGAAHAGTGISASGTSIVAAVGAPGGAYGDFYMPLAAGSGGKASTTCDAGLGGGAVHVHATNFTLNGKIRMDATDGESSDVSNSRGGGGGSGGSVFVDVDRLLSSAGSISANGGNGGRGKSMGGGSGSGGRISIMCSVSEDGSENRIPVTAYAGKQLDDSSKGAASGTIYYDCGAKYRILILDTGLNDLSGVVESTIAVDHVAALVLRTVIIKRHAGLLLQTFSPTNYELFATQVLDGDGTGQIRIQRGVAFIVGSLQSDTTRYMAGELGKTIHGITNVEWHALEVPPIKTADTMNFSVVAGVLEQDAVLLTPPVARIHSSSWSINGRWIGADSLEITGGASVRFGTTSSASDSLQLKVYDFDGIKLESGSVLEFPSQSTVNVESDVIVRSNSALILGASSVVNADELELSTGKLELSLASTVNIVHDFVVEPASNLTIGDESSLNVWGSLGVTSPLDLVVGEQLRLHVGGNVSLVQATARGSMRAIDVGGSFIMKTGHLMLNNATVEIQKQLHIQDNSQIDLVMLNEVHVDSMWLSNDSSIIGDGRGFSGGSGPGRGQNVGDGAAHASYGIGYDGLMVVNALGSPGSPYGRFDTPFDAGSGGHLGSGTGCCPAGSGGAAVHLVASSQMLINGLISVNGINGGSDAQPGMSAGGGGSGGSIWIETKILLASNGKLRSNGGRGGQGGSRWGGGASGGRISVVCTDHLNSSDPSTLALQAVGGAKHTETRVTAGAGTSYMDCQSMRRTVIVDNGSPGLQNLIPAMILGDSVRDFYLEKIDLSHRAGLQFAATAPDPQFAILAVSQLEGDGTGKLIVDKYQYFVVRAADVLDFPLSRAPAVVWQDNPDPAWRQWQQTSDKYSLSALDANLSTMSCEVHATSLLVTPTTVTIRDTEWIVRGLWPTLRDLSLQGSAVLNVSATNFNGTSMQNVQMTETAQANLLGGGDKRIGRIAQHHDSVLRFPDASAVAIDLDWSMTDTASAITADSVSISVTSDYKLRIRSRILIGSNNVFKIGGDWIVDSRGMSSIGMGTSLEVSGDWILTDASMNGQLRSIVVSQNFVLESSTVGMWNADVTVGDTLQLRGTSRITISNVNKISATNVIIESGATIDGSDDELSYIASVVPDGAGAPHGAYGTRYDGSPVEVDIHEDGAVFGDFRFPAQTGRRGGNSSTTPTARGGYGGASLHLVTSGTLKFDGSIRVDGGDGDSVSATSARAAGGGSGGSVWIEAGTLLASTGTISAVGGNGGTSHSSGRPGGGASGGRIAFYCSNDPQNSVSNIFSSAHGGTVGTSVALAGGAGSAYFDCGEWYRVVIADNGSPNRAQQQTTYILAPTFTILQLERVVARQYARVMFFPQDVGTNNTLWAIRYLEGDTTASVVALPKQTLVVPAEISDFALPLLETQLPDSGSGSISEHLDTIIQERRYRLADTTVTLSGPAIVTKPDSQLVVPEYVVVNGARLDVGGVIGGMRQLTVTNGGVVQLQSSGRAFDAENFGAFTMLTLSMSQQGHLQLPPSSSLSVRGNLAIETDSRLKLGEDAMLSVDGSISCTNGSGIDAGTNVTVTAAVNFEGEAGSVSTFGNSSVIRVNSDIVLRSGRVLGGLAIVNAQRNIQLFGDAELSVRQAQVDARWLLELHGTSKLSVHHSARIAATNITLRDVASISGDAQGYANGQGPGSTTDYGVGASHAGFGTGYDGSEPNVNLGDPGSPYGATLDPVLPGSGGADGYLCCLGGYGGSAIQLVARNALYVNGSISSNGGNGGSSFDANTFGAGGGSGGSILIETQQLLASKVANITAIGAAGGQAAMRLGGGGSGGRISVRCDSDTGNAIQNWKFDAHGGERFGDTSLGAAAGTIYVNCGVKEHNFVIDNKYSTRDLRRSWVLDSRGLFPIGNATLNNYASLVFKPQDRPVSELTPMLVRAVGGDGTGSLEIDTPSIAVFGVQTLLDENDIFETTQLLSQYLRTVHTNYNVSVQDWTLDSAVLRLGPDTTSVLPSRVYICNPGQIYNQGRISGVETIEYCSGYPQPGIQGDSNIYGCMDSLASNYNPNAAVDDGSCQYASGVRFGCTYPIAQNYDPVAEQNDGSCILPPGLRPGCSCSDALNYDPRATLFDKTCVWAGSASFGCMYTEALNYNSAALRDDGSCDFTDIDELNRQLLDKQELRRNKVDELDNEKTAISVENIRHDSSMSSMSYAKLVLQGKHNSAKTQLQQCGLDKSAIQHTYDNLTDTKAALQANLTACQNDVSLTKQLVKDMEDSLVAYRNGSVMLPNQLVEFTLSTMTIDPNTVTIPVRIRRRGGSLRSIGFELVTIDGSAKSGFDYTNVRQFLTFKENQTEIVIDVCVTAGEGRATTKTFSLEIRRVFTPSYQNTATVQSVRAGVGWPSKLDISLLPSADRPADSEFHARVWWNYWLRTLSS